MKILYTIIFITLLCNSHKSEINTNPNGKLVQYCIVNNKWEYSYKYNNDNTLKKIIFKTDGVTQYTQVFKYKGDKIVESLKENTDGSNTVKKQFEYKEDLIIKEVMYLNGELHETSHYDYNSDKFLKKITTKSTINNYKSTKTTLIEKIAKNKIKVMRKGIATHIISYNEKLTPQSKIPGYKPLVQINNNGISACKTLTEIFSGDECIGTIETDFEFGDDGKTVLGAKTTTYRNANLIGTQEFEYLY